MPTGFEERHFTSAMKLFGVLLLSVLLISNAADAQLTLNSTRMDQNLEKRSLNGKGDCPGGFVYFGYCYKFVSQPKTWIDAELHCRTLAPGGHLASIHWEEQNRIIAEKFSQTERTWIGFNDIYKENSFLWTDGSSSDFTHWDKEQPDNYHGQEHCVHFVARTPDWNDLLCDSKLCFLCSYKLPSPCCE
ncbi:C-type lectin Cal-like [Hemiscyllium ocellatum]|uniref:C-type lectin Cal-like n=1 Tax=Hemiscyllium ocellatum TaxID=170820 RepID=UPI0029675667|nr:C-type lectin Cal-like [Hemiscyllium ocellatum]